MKTFATIFALLLALTLFSFPAAAKDKDTTPGRLLTGKVVNRDDSPLSNAVVFVTDTRPHAVKTYIVGPDGG